MRGFWAVDALKSLLCVGKGAYIFEKVLLDTYGTEM